jgi:hypothetical protein
MDASKAPRTFTLAPVGKRRHSGTLVAFNAPPRLRHEERAPAGNRPRETERRTACCVLRISRRGRAITTTFAGEVGCVNLGSAGSDGADKRCPSIASRRLSSPHDCERPAYSMKQPDTISGRCSRKGQYRHILKRPSQRRPPLSLTILLFFPGQACQVKYL